MSGFKLSKDSVAIFRNQSYPFIIFSHLIIKLMPNEPLKKSSIMKKKDSIMKKKDSIMQKNNPFKSDSRIT